MTTINGVQIYKNSATCLCIVASFSPDLQACAKRRLVFVCHGSTRATLEGDHYTYKDTIKEFWERLKGKDNLKKMGMVAEFLAHILILEIFKDFIPASAFFNLEERSLKKGFDLIFKDGTNVWIAEVKSGMGHANTKADDRIKELISDSKRDLKKKLNEDRPTLWQNAINHLDITLAQSDERKAIKDILKQNKTAALSGDVQPQNHNVILVGGLFADMSDFVQHAAIVEAAEGIRKENLFKSEMILAFQKTTFDTVVNFFESEAKNA